jgi:hypothetical protein
VRGFLGAARATAAAAAAGSRKAAGGHISAPAAAGTQGTSGRSLGKTQRSKGPWGILGGSKAKQSYRHQNGVCREGAVLGGSGTLAATPGALP